MSTQSSQVLPLIDDLNPLYCPAIPASAYIEHIRQQSRNVNNRHRYQRKAFSSFYHILDRSLQSDDSDYSDDSTPVLPHKKHFQASSREGLLSIPGWEKARRRNIVSNGFLPAYMRLNRNPRPSVSVGMKLLNGRKRCHRPSFSDLRGPPIFSKSIESVHDSSFEIELKREKLKFSINHCTLSSTPTKPAPFFYGSVPVRAYENINDLIEHLDTVLPGIRIKERLLQLPYLTHQDITDFLTTHGYITARIMNIFRSLGIRKLSLADSCDENGLNITGVDLLSAFGEHGSFLFLTELSFSGVMLQDENLVHIHRLPKLSKLFLDNTGIGNEAVFLLVPLKHTLTHLSLAINPFIDDDAIPAILLFTKLSFLSVLDTSIQMVGLRRLAQTITDEAWSIKIEIPSECDRYIDNMHLKYFLSPAPPLITKPAACPDLSASALEQNLLAHAGQNPNIVCSGTREEMVERLSTILKTRQSDILVKYVLRGRHSIGISDGSVQHMDSFF